MHFDNDLSLRQISKVINVSKTTVGEYISLFKKSGLSWPLPKEYLSEEKLSKKLDPNYERAVTTIDFVEINQELKANKNLTLQLLWDELKEANAMPYSYSNIFASLAEFERNLIRERTLAGLASARARGRKGGRPELDKSKLNAAIQLYNKRELTVEQICRAIGMGLSETLCK